jgi:uncharacterized protein YbaP (TraB family)
MTGPERTLIALALLAGLAPPAAALDAGCRPLQAAEADYDGPPEFDNGLLWRINGATGEPSYLFGTIHVGDPAVLELPDAVSGALDESSAFAMEVLPDPAQMVMFSSLMFFGDGRRLDQLLPGHLYARTVEILNGYQLPEQAVAGMKPWAAFLTMSYPPETQTVLDLQLLERAQLAGAALHGLESMEEQGRVFNDLELPDQVQLLVDTVCHYAVISEDFARMKELYLDRDLRGLYVYGQRHAFEDNALYERITERLLTARNRVMVERMLPLIDSGDAFVAVGAMHLPGSDGILSLLADRGYAVERVY